MRKVVVLLVLFALSVLTLAVPVFAAPEKIPMTYYGRVVYSKIEIPHYELVNPKTNSVYVLTEPFNFKTYEGKLVWVEGYGAQGAEHLPARADIESYQYQVRFELRTGTRPETGTRNDISARVDAGSSKTG